jgi:O-antigen/teichoic acid export membrane protein
LISNNKLEELRALVNRSLRWVYLGTLLVGLSAVAVYPLGLQFVKNKAEFIQSWPIFAILAVGFIISSGYIPFSNMVMLAGRPGLHSIMMSIQVLFNILANFLLVPLLGGWGAAIATSLSYVLLIFLVKAFVYRVIKVKI